MDKAAFKDEVNLLYVSATRAKKTLVINKLLVNILAKIAENEKMRKRHRLNSVMLLEAPVIDCEPFSVISHVEIPVTKNKRT